MPRRPAFVLLFIYIQTKSLDSEKAVYQYLAGKGNDEEVLVIAKLFLERCF